jgi:hypothetical protein
LRADLVEVNGANFNDYARIARSDISSSNSVISWANYYKAINLANTLMFYDTEVLSKDKSFTPQMKDVVDAEALFIRSLSYFYLIRLWNQVPLVLQPSISDTNNLYIPKSPEHVVIAQILSDLLIAKDKANTTEYQTNLPYFKGRANKYSIMALLADVYLWNEQYQKCIDYCDSITNTGLFGLESTTNWFKLYNPGNSRVESIFEIQFEDSYDNQENPIYANLIPLTGAAQVRMKTQYSLLLTDIDIRRCGSRGPIWKYRGADIEGILARSLSERDANIIYYRYADILLMKAEALTEIGKCLSKEYP